MFSTSFVVLLLSSIAAKADTGGTLAGNISNVTSWQFEHEQPIKEHNIFFYILNGFMLILISTSIVASILDYRMTKENALSKRPGWQALMSFSIPRNTANVFSLKKEPDSILCIDAIRFISFTWIVAYHSVMFYAEEDFKENRDKLLSDVDNIFTHIFLNPFHAVDTFLLISGLLVSYTFFKKIHRNPAYAFSKFNWTMYYVHRWFRITPAYLLFIGCLIAWAPQNASEQVVKCQKFWWKNALYINNFNGFNDMCYGVSWYLTVDMQLYCIAPIFLLALHYSWRSGMCAIFGGVLASICAIFFLTIRFILPGTLVVIDRYRNEGFIKYIYINPLTRCIPYLVGIFCGFFIVQVNKKNIEFRRPKKWVLTLCWLLATISALTSIFSVFNYMRGHSEWGVIASSLYGSFGRIGWAAAVAWVVLACTFDWAGPVKTLLEHPIWYPLGRLSYCCYLVHISILVLIQDSEYVSLWHTYLRETIPIVCLSCLVAYMWTCLVEIPFCNIEAIVVGILMRKWHVHEDTAIARPVATKIRAERKGYTQITDV